MSEPAKGRPEPVALAAFAVAAFAIRLLSWHAVFRGGRVLFIDGDDYYHLRRMMTAAADFPRLPAFDAYLGSPAGWRVIWPSLYDQFGGGLIRLIGGRAPELALSQTIAAFIPPVAGAATVAVFYRAARELLDENAARWSAALAALLPMIVGYTLLGRPDHHCFENLWFPAAVPLLLALLTGRGRGLPRAAIGAAVLLALGVSFWIGSIIFSLVFAAAAAGLSMRAPAEAREGPAWAGIALLIEGALHSPYAFGAWAGEIRFDAPTAFQPLLLAALGLGLCALHARGKASRRPAWLGAGALACAALIAEGGARSVAGFVGAPPVFRLFSEMQPLFSPGGNPGLATAHSNLGFAFWLLPVLLPLYALRTRASAGKRLVLAWAGVTGVLALLQTRYLYHFCFPAALLLGWGAERAASALRRKYSGGALSSPAGSRAAVAVVLAALLAAPLKAVVAIALCAPQDLTGDPRLIDALDWIRLNTPPTRSLWTDQGRPEYGVYSLHSVGDQVAAVAQRPAAAGNMHTMRTAIADSIDFFYMTDEEQAYRFLRGRGFRYVLLNDLVGERILPEYDRLLGRTGYELTSRPDGTVSLSPDAMRFVYMRLYHLNGAAPRGIGAVPALKRFRLVYESTSEPERPDRWKVFELLPGRPS